MPLDARSPAHSAMLAQAMRRIAPSCAAAALLAGCTVPFNWFGQRPPPPPPPKTTTWESDTEAGAKAFKEGRLEEAERSLELARERAALGKGKDLEVADSLVNLAVVHRAQGDTAGALELQKEALAIREKTLGPDHPEVAVSLNSIAALYSVQDDYAAAEPLLTRALTIREKALGANDLYTGQSLNNLALLHAAQGRYAEAEPLYKRAAAIFEQQQRSRELAKVLENYAALLDETGRIDDAKRMDARAQGLSAEETKGTTGNQ
jgi:tetratricopeptide (TPR) repeat protein